MAGHPTRARTSTPAPGPLYVGYGADSSQFGSLLLPRTVDVTVPVVVLIHGGGWQAGSTLDEFTPHAEELAESGVAVWNIEYRAVGNGGGWPTTLEDVAAAVDALAGPVQEASGNRLDTGRVRVVGYSAGGQLAVWLAGRPHMPAGAPGANPLVLISAVVGLAPVLDLEFAAHTDSTPNVVDFMGGTTADHPDRYELASPIRKLPVGIPVTCVHGDNDTTVPVTQSQRYVTAAKAAGDPAQLMELAGVDHKAVVDIAGKGWEFSRGAALRGL